MPSKALSSQEDGSLLIFWIFVKEISEEHIEVLRNLLLTVSELEPFALITVACAYWLV